MPDVEYRNVSLDVVSVTPPVHPVVPRDLFFNDDTMVSVIAYSVLFFVAAFGNLTVFITLFRNRHRKSRVNLFIMHLSIADMIVTFVMIPMEIGWHITVSWKAGDIACRILMFFRPFGFYLSSCILVAISLDRYFAIKHPLSINDADMRGKLMLLVAWLFSILASVPQSVIFHVEQHPAYSWFTQCVTFNFYPTVAHELAYNLFNMAALYAAPLLIIVISYTMILWEISKKSRESKGQVSPVTSCQSLKRSATFRRSGIGRIEKARVRTLKMTIVIVLVFVTCWTPYFVINAWFWFDKDSAQKINAKITRGLLIFAVSNSCVNPLVYGIFMHTFPRDFKTRCLISSRNQADKIAKSSKRSQLRQRLLRRLTKHDENIVEQSPEKPSHQTDNACIDEANAMTQSTDDVMHVSTRSRGKYSAGNNFDKYLLI